MWKMDVGERAALIDQSVLSLGHPHSLCVTDIQHVKSAIYFPLMFETSSKFIFFNLKLKAFSSRLSGSFSYLITCMFSYFTSEVNCVFVNCSLLKGKAALQV